MRNTSTVLKQARFPANARIYASGGRLGRHADEGDSREESGKHCQRENEGAESTCTGQEKTAAAQIGILRIHTGIPSYSATEGNFASTNSQVKRIAMRHFQKNTSALEKQRLCSMTTTTVSPEHFRPLISPEHFSIQTRTRLATGWPNDRCKPLSHFPLAPSKLAGSSFSKERIAHTGAIVYLSSHT